MRRAQTLTFVWALCLTACTYGPAQHRVWIKQAEGRPETRTFAAIVQSQVRREATGLAAFRDGGSPIITDQVVTVYVREPGMRARAPGERVYMRITAWYNSVSVRTEDEGPFTARFVLNRQRELVPVR